jgi:hypothetical protein
MLNMLYWPLLLRPQTRQCYYAFNIASLLVRRVSSGMTVIVSISFTGINLGWFDDDLLLLLF